MQVQRAEFPDEFGVPVPERWNDGFRQPVGASQPVHPAVELDPFGLGVVGAEQVPVDRIRWLRHEWPVEIVQRILSERVIVIAVCTLDSGL